MKTEATRQTTTNLAKRLSDKTVKLSEAKATIKEHVTTIKQQDDIINALKSEINDLELQVQSYYLGATVVTINNDFVSSAVTIPPYNEALPTQDVPTELNTTLYKKFPFYKVNGNTIVKDEAQYKKYKLGGIL